MCLLLTLLPCLFILLAVLAVLYIYIYSETETEEDWIDPLDLDSMKRGHVGMSMFNNKQTNKQTNKQKAAPEPEPKPLITAHTLMNNVNPISINIQKEKRKRAG